jgi:elongation factor 1-gamma
MDELRKFTIGPQPSVHLAPENHFTNTIDHAPSAVAIFKMMYKLHSDAGNFRTFKCLIAAEMAGVTVEVLDTKVPPAGSIMNKLPVLEAGGCSISNSNAIARYISKLRADAELLGKTLIESAQVDSWIDYCAFDIELPATLWYYPVLGFMPFNADAAEKAKGDLAAALTVLEAHLSDKTYLVGDKITLADITLVSALVYPFKFVCDPKYRGAFPSVMRWFDTCVNQESFLAVMGTVVLCTKEYTNLAAGGAAQGGAPKEKKEKKEKAPKAPKAPKEAKPKEEKKPKEKAPKEDDGDDEPKPVKKEDHAFKILDKEMPSPFSMDTWKKTYSNCDDYHLAMYSFFESFDGEGWSIFRGDYKYNEELKVLFMTSNLIAGFIQRTEEIRKWLFGTKTIRGTEGEGMKVTSYFLIRGQSIQPLIDCNDDAECYTWTKLSLPVSEADKKLLYDYWCSEGPLDGLPCLDSRAYK